MEDKKIIHIFVIDKNNQKQRKMKTITVYDRETSEKVTTRTFETSEECYDWFHDNYGEEEYFYEKLG